MQIWSRDTPESGGTKPSKTTSWVVYMDHVMDLYFVLVMGFLFLKMMSFFMVSGFLSDPHIMPLSSESGTNKRVKAIFWS